MIALAVAETIVWARFFYAFPVLLLRWEGDFGWGRDVIALPYISGFAAAPFLAALFWRAGGYDLMLAAAACMVIAGLFLLSFARRQAVRIEPGPL